MSLFRDVSKSDTPIHPKESTFEFLERSSWPECETTRLLIDEWLKEFPTQEHEGLVSRLRSKDTDKHDAAIFELVVHHFLLTKGCSILAYEPQVGGHHPDFLILTRDGNRVLVEATIITSQSPQDRAQRTHEWSVQHTLNTVPRIPYHLSLRFKSRFLSSPNLSRVRSIFASWAADPNRSRILLIEEAGAKIEVRTDLESGPSYLGPTISIVSPFGLSGFSSASEDIKKKIRRKAEQLSAADIPAVLATKHSILNDSNSAITTAMFGSERMLLNIETGDVIDTSREDNASLLHKGNPRNTLLSGLLAFSRAEPWSLIPTA